MPTTTEQSKRIRNHVKKLFSWNVRTREAAKAALDTADSDEKLAVTEAVFPIAVADPRPGWVFIWLSIAAVGTGCVLPIDFGRPGLTFAWLGAIGVGIYTHMLLWHRKANRHEVVTAVLDSASDYRLVPPLLSYRMRMGARFGSASAAYLSVISCLERLLPQVTFEHIGEYRAPWRRTLTPFLLDQPLSTMLTLEALRLAPAFGDQETLRCIARLANSTANGTEWGTPGPPATTPRIRKAARAAAIALREALARNKEHATLLRASSAAREHPSLALLRASGGTAATSSSELLRATDSDQSSLCDPPTALEPPHIGHNDTAVANT